MKYLSLGHVCHYEPAWCAKVRMGPEKMKNLEKISFPIELQYLAAHLCLDRRTGSNRQESRQSIGQSETEEKNPTVVLGNFVVVLTCKGNLGSLCALQRYTLFDTTLKDGKEDMKI